ncbi:hypothetical protein FPV67DRAFT_251307 [Lyophyllum atratum]|nr:hypothetical protein FPV67DRAFT_251307 [Lyophyllum atratum]
MPSCFPCWPVSSVVQFKEENTLARPSFRRCQQCTTNVIIQPSARNGKSIPVVEDLGKPTASEYAGETAKEFLKILEAVAQEIPVPGIASAVKIATNLIQACEESHATLERAEELKLRIKTLVTVLVNELKGKKAEDVQKKLLEDINSLESDLKYIQKKLDEIASQHALLIIFFRSFNEEKVRKCTDRLDISLERFNLTRQIDHAGVIGQLEKQIIAFHSAQQKSLERIQVTMEDVKAILDERLPAASSLQARTRAAVPANIDIFHGREAVVAELVSVLTASVPEGQKRPRVCLLGPGGMGKTCTARAVMAHPDIKIHFTNGNRVWVPCVKATSVSLFLDTLYSSSGTARNTGNALNDILSELKSSDPLVLLLDNFETPWNIDRGRSEVEQILRDIHQIPHVTIFVTMRASTPPCDDIHWHSVGLGGVDSDAARNIYSDVYSASSADPDVPALLEIVGHMPLAITLMANIGKLLGLSAKKLLEEYDRRGTAMLGHGSDPEHSMDICISLSVDSPAMKQHSEAFPLLATLSMLPVGTTYDMLVDWWARTSPNVIGELGVLREASLVDQRGSTFFVLPVIRHYILNPTRFPDSVRPSVIESACEFLAQHKSSPGEDSYKDHAAAISIEEGNLQAILLEAITPTPRLVEALIVLARHQEATRPRTEVIQHALKVTLRMEDNASLLGAVLSCYGAICLRLSRYRDAKEHFKLARESFLSIPDRKQAARCLLYLIDVHGYASDLPDELQQDSAIIADAKSEFESIDDSHGIALCLYSLGVLRWQCEPSTKNYPEIIDLLKSARATFAEVKDLMNLAHSAYYLAKVYFWDSAWEAARTWATAAVQEYDRLGRYEPDGTRMLARVCIVMGDYDAALKMLMRTLEQSKSNGSLADTALTLEGMGRAWSKMGRKVDAREAFEECLRILSVERPESTNYGLRCQFFLRKLEDPSSRPSYEERRALSGGYPEKIDDLL